LAQSVVEAGHMPEHADESDDAESEVRRLVARELHDRVAQTLTSMLVEVENFKSEQVGWQDVLQQLDTIQSSTRQVLGSIRQLLHDLRGEDTFSGGLAETLGSLIARFAEKTGIKTELDLKPGWPEALTPTATLNLYRIVEEALANVRLHSLARNARVVVGPETDTEFGVSVSDDGRGLDTHPSRPVGLGTIGMRERAMLLGGQLSIESDGSWGTRVQARFPTALLVPDGLPPAHELVTKRKSA
jgi:signal transduction histidine kinase